MNSCPFKGHSEWNYGSECGGLSHTSVNKPKALLVTQTSKTF